MLSIAGEQKKSSRQPFLAGVKELIDQIFFHSDVSGDHIGYEPIGKIVFPVQNPNHLVFFNNKYAGRRNRGGRRHTSGSTRQTAFAHEIAGSQNRDNGFFAAPIDHSNFDASLANEHDILRGVALREDDFFPSKLGNRSPQASGVEKYGCVETTASIPVFRGRVAGLRRDTSSRGGHHGLTVPSIQPTV